MLITRTECVSANQSIGTPVHSSPDVKFDIVGHGIPIPVDRPLFYHATARGSKDCISHQVATPIYVGTRDEIKSD